jgi:hypothetical protein
MIKPYVSIVLLHSGLNLTSGLSDEELPTLAVDVTYARCFQTENILDEPKESGDHPKREDYSFDVIS